MSDIELESEGSTNMENDHYDYSYDAPVQQYLKYQKGHIVVWTDLHDKQEKIHVLKFGRGQQGQRVPDWFSWQVDTCFSAESETIQHSCCKFGHYL